MSNFHGAKQSTDFAMLFAGKQIHLMIYEYIIK